MWCLGRTLPTKTITANLFLLIRMAVELLHKCVCVCVCVCVRERERERWRNQIFKALFDKDCSFGSGKLV